MFKALLYAYVLGGLTFIPLLIFLAIFITVYTSVPVGDPDMSKGKRRELQQTSLDEKDDDSTAAQHHRKTSSESDIETNDMPMTRKGWLTMRRTYEEPEGDTSYVNLVRSFIDSKSKDPRRSRPKDMWFVVLKRNILYLYEDEQMTECGAVIELSRHQVVIYPEDLPDAELFAKRNAICLRQRPSASPNLASLTKQMKLEEEIMDNQIERSSSSTSKKEQDALAELEKKKEAARDEAFDPSTPWFIFVRSNLEMEDWYLALIHASSQPAQTPTLLPLRDVFDPRDMNHLVATLDDQPDVIPMRWLNALIGRIFFSHYKTHALEAYIIGRLMKKINMVKRPQFLTSLEVTEVSVGNRAPMLSKPMLKELSKEGDASLEVHFQYKGEIRVTVEATALINLGARFKSYTVKIALAVVLKELEGNVLVKVKRPPSNRIWYAFTKAPRMVMEIEPIVSDRQITWGMILSAIETQIKQVIEESVVLPNMDDIAFSDSLPFEFRGGIWSDASRAAHPTPHAQPNSTDVTDDERSTTSLPVPATSNKDAADPTIHTSLSEEAITTHNSINGTQLPRVVVDDPTDSAENNSRRKNWFNSVRSDDGKSNLVAPDLSLSDNDSVGGSSRGRSEAFDEFGVRKRSQSRQSTRSVMSTRSHKSAAPTEDSIVSDISHSLRRSLSRHFNRDSTDAKLGSDGTSIDSRQGKSNLGTQQKSSEGLPVRSPSPPSFFSTLKSKASDKQTLSSTAKEAMRKWGVNWGNRKEGGSPPITNDEPSQDSSSSVKSRASSADVHTAISDPKDRARSDQDASDGSSGSESKATNEGSVNPSIVAAAARLATPKLATKSQPLMSFVSADVDEEEKPKFDAPVRVQPQAPKMMTIPGIHASHRGEVQALGYVAPSPPPPPTTTLESKLNLRNPTIQTVYRFWRNNSISNSNHDLTTGEGALQDSGTKITTEPDSISIDIDDHEDTSRRAPPTILSPKPTPPPLPPRSNAVAAAKDEFSHACTSSSPPSSSPSPASEALKRVAVKDEETRNQLLIDQDRKKAEEGVASKPSVEGALNASRSRSPISAPRSRSPPPLPPRGASVQIAAS